MKYKYLTLTILAGLLGWYSCTSDFIVPDISKKNVTIILPQDNTTSSSAVQTFIWTKLDGATSYNLQIARPSFAGIQQLVVDTNVTGTQFTYALVPGKTYQWRLCAQNSIYKTPYTTYTLTIDSSGSITSQTVVFIYPSSNNFYSNTNLNTFQWYPVAGAVDYRFQVISQSTGTTITDISQTGTSYATTLTQGTYTVQVRAQNNSSNSPYTSRVFTVLTTPPNPSSPQTPLYGASVPAIDTLTWIGSTGRVSDSLFINTDSTFVQAPLVAIKTTNTYYRFTAGTSGTTYFWRLRTGDAAGNWSVYSTKSKFKIN